MAQTNTRLTYTMPGETTADNGKKYKHTWVFDYTGCTVGELIRPAARSIKIDVQGQVRKNPELFPEDEPIMVNVKEHIAGGRGVQLSRAQILAAAASDTELMDALLKMAQERRAK